MQAVDTLIDAYEQKEDEASLAMVDSVLADYGTQMADAAAQAQTNDDRWGAREIDGITAGLVDLRTRARAAMISLATTPDVVEGHLDVLLSTFGDLPRQASTMLDASEILYGHGRTEQAREMLSRCPYNRALTVGDLTSYEESGSLDLRFRYWRLQYHLATNDDQVPESIPPSITTPGGDDIAPSAPVHSDRLAIDLVSRLDSAIRKLAQLDVEVASGRPPSILAIQTEVVALFDLFNRSTSRGSASLREIRSQKRELMRIIVAMVCRYGNGLPEWMKGQSRAPVRGRSSGMVGEAEARSRRRSR